MATQIFTYRAYNEQSVLIDIVKTSRSIRAAKNIVRQSWSGYIKITCDESPETLVSKK